MAKRISLTDLTDRLESPDREKAAAQVRAQLAALCERLDAEIASGLSRDEFERKQRIRAAAQAAATVFEDYMKA